MASISWIRTDGKRCRSPKYDAAYMLYDYVNKHRDEFEIIIKLDCTNMYYLRDLFSCYINTGVSSCVYRGCPNLKCVKSIVNVLEIDTDCCNMFRNCKNLESVTFSDASNVSDMKYMFAGCSNLKSVNIGNAVNVMSARYMFKDCVNLVDFSPFNFALLEFMEGMFSNSCRELFASRSSFYKIYNFYRSLCELPEGLDICKERAKILW